VPSEIKFLLKEPFLGCNQTITRYERKTARLPQKMEGPTRGGRILVERTRGDQFALSVALQATTEQTAWFLFPGWFTSAVQQPFIRFDSSMFRRIQLTSKPIRTDFLHLILSVEGEFCGLPIFDELEIKPSIQYHSD
jgi:hypothetical protein